MASAMTWGGATAPMDRLFAVDGGSVAGLDDAALWERFATRRDEAAFAALVVRHGPMVLRAARAIVGDHHAAEDLVQTTFATLARRGGSIRRFETLAPWLHRVATRAAIRHRNQTRRRSDRERHAEARSADPRGSDRAAIVAAIHAELDRLPASYRAPIVLCDLEGWTKASAAAHLGWTEGAVRGRLERGRARLRVQLTRHGFTPALGSMAVWLGGVEASAASLALRPGLVGSAVRAGIAAAGSSLGPVAWVSQTSADLVGNLSRLGPVRAGLVAVGLAGSVGVGAFGWIESGRAPAIPAAGLADDSAGPIPAPRPAPAILPAPVPVKDDPSKPGDLVTLSGRIVEPTGGQPVPGASVRVRPYVNLIPRPAEIATTTDNAGRFTVRVPRHLVGGTYRDAVKVIATAAGFGPGWQGLGAALNLDLDDLTIPLTVDDVPLEGRVVSNGQPVAGVLVRVGEIYASTTADLSPWIDRVRRIGIKGAWEGENWRQLVDLGSFSDLTTRTDAEGRFRLDGLGRERVAELLISRVGFATTQVSALTRAGEPLVGRPQGEANPTPITFEPNRFEATLPPGRAVAGVIRDAKTGPPIAGIPLEGLVVDEQSWNVPLPGIRGVSDPAGHYRLDGLPIANQYRVLVRPIAGQPYLHCDLPTPTTEGLAVEAPLTFDFNLRQGVVIRGRVTNSISGQPIVNAAVETFAFKGKPELDRFPGLDRSIPSWDRTDADGRYEVVALPGRGLLTVVATGAQMITRDFEGMEGYDPKHQQFNTTSSIGNLLSSNIVRPIQPEAGSSPTIDLTIDPGASVTGTLVDPAGQPLTGWTATGLHPSLYLLSEANPPDRFEVLGLRSDESRRVSFFHDDRKLAGSVLVHASQPDSPVVTLQPSASVIGRLVATDGKPQADLSLTELYRDRDLPHRGWIPELHLVDVDAEGRFRIDGLVPGLAYKVYPVQEVLKAAIFDRLILQPGEIKDLGDIVLRPIPEK